MRKNFYVDYVASNGFEKAREELISKTETGEKLKESLFGTMASIIDHNIQMRNGVYGTAPYEKLYDENDLEEELYHVAKAALLEAACSSNLKNEKMRNRASIASYYHFHIKHEIIQFLVKETKESLYSGMTSYNNEILLNFIKAGFRDIRELKTTKERKIAVKRVNAYLCLDFKKNKDLPLKGMSFLIDCEYKWYRSQDIKAHIIAQGGSVLQKIVEGDNCYYITSNASSYKANRAKACGFTIITEDEFFESYENCGSKSISLYTLNNLIDIIDHPNEPFDNPKNRVEISSDMDIDEEIDSDADALSDAVVDIMKSQLTKDDFDFFESWFSISVASGAYVKCMSKTKNRTLLEDELAENFGITKTEARRKIRFQRGILIEQLRNTNFAPRMRKYEMLLRKVQRTKTEQIVKDAAQKKQALLIRFPDRQQAAAVAY